MLLARNRVVTPSDHGALVEVAAAFCMSVSLVFLCARFTVRWPWAKFHGMDDVFTLLASISYIVQMVLVFQAVSAGLGKRPQLLSDSSEIRADKFIYFSDLLYVLTMYLSRFSVVMLFFRLEQSRTKSVYLRALAGSAVVLCPVSLIIIATRQHNPTTWILPSPATGSSNLARWVVVEALGCLLDIAITMYPWILVRELQMRTSVKVGVILGVALRSPILAISVLRMVSLAHSLPSDEYLWAYVDTAILTQVETSFTLISATVPVLQSFLRAAKSPLLGEIDYGTGMDSHKASYGSSELQTITSRMMSVATEREDDKHSIEVMGGVAGETTTIITQGSRGVSLASDSSQQAIFIEQTVDVR